MIAHIDGDGHRYAIQVASASFRGTRVSNEDALGLMNLGAKGLCCALSDGAGGHGHGALAAQLTVDAVLDGFRETPLFAPANLASLISQAEHRVSTAQPTSVSRQHMSATVVLLCIDPTKGQALWAHWGDSRLYCFRAGEMRSRTEDHSLIQQLLDAGLYEETDVRKLHNRNLLAGAVGAEGQVPPSILPKALALEPGDVFLLCSDGLWENLHESEMQELLTACTRPDDWIHQMLEKIAALGKPHQDNLSALTVWIQAGEKSD